VTGVDGSDPGRRAAAAMRRVGHDLAGLDIDDAHLERLATLLDTWHDEVAEAPVRDKRAFMLQRGGGLARFMVTGERQPPPPDGARVVFDELSFIGGASSGLSMGFAFRRDGEEMVAETSFGRGFEGPPDRVHGGAVAAAVDEAMSQVLHLVGQPAYTVQLSLSFRAPAPLGRPVTFRSRLERQEGRKLFIGCEGSSGEGVFVQGEGLFILAPPPELPSA